MNLLKAATLVQLLGQFQDAALLLAVALLAPPHVPLCWKLLAPSSLAPIASRLPRVEWWRSMAATEMLEGLGLETQLVKVAVFESCGHH